MRIPVPSFLAILLQILDLVLSKYLLINLGSRIGGPKEKGHRSLKMKEQEKVGKIVLVILVKARVYDANPLS